MQKEFESVFTSSVSSSEEGEKSSGLISNSSEAASVNGGVASSTAIAVPGRSLGSKPSEAKENDWSPSVQTLLDQPPATLPQRLIAGGIVFCFAFGAWAWFGTIEQVGKAQGKLVPKGETYKIEPINSGKITSIAVEEGETVKAGQVLAELDTELAEKEVERLQQMLLAYQTELSQKQGLQERMRLEAQTREAIASSEAQAQQAAIAQAKEKAATVRQVLAQLDSETTAFQTRQAQLQPISAIAQEELKQLQAELAAHQERIARLKTLTQEGAISQEYVFQAEQALRQTQQQINQSKLQALSNTDEQLFQAQQSLRDRGSAITQNKGELASALKEAERLEAELAVKQAQGRSIQLEAQQQIQQLEVEITQLKAKIAEAKNLLVSAQTQLKQRFLRSPVNGVVLSLDLQNTGEVVQPGETIAEIAPLDAPLILSAVLPNREAGFVKEGMPVKIKLEAYPYQDYGVIPGKVISISADAKPDQNLGAVYRVKIALDRSHIRENQQNINFKAGQTATADIIIRNRRIADVLLDPIKQLQKGGLDL